jgi:hypothetical protein
MSADNSNVHTHTNGHTSASSSDTPRLTNYINGEFVAPIDGRYLDNLAPATSKLLCEIPRSQKNDVDQGRQTAPLPSLRARLILLFV